MWGAGSLRVTSLVSHNDLVIARKFSLVPFLRAQHVLVTVTQHGEHGLLTTHKANQAQVPGEKFFLTFFLLFI